MPTIKEAEMPSEYYDCIACGEYAGDIFLCGEGMICTACFAKEASCDEAELFQGDDAPREYKDRVKISLLNRREGEEN